jgi:VanZ family protein
VIPSSRARRARLLWLWGPVVGYMAAIFFVSSLPAAPLPQQMSDKAAHMLGYLLLGALSARAVAGGVPRRITAAAAAAALLVASGYGLFDEWHQSFVPGRSPDVADWLVDTTGAAMGIGLCWAWGMMAVRSDV